MSTVNPVGNGLTGASGTGNFAGTTSPVFVTPTLGAASATSLAFSSTSGIIGTTTNNNAAAGSVGEFASNVRARDSAISLTTATVADVASVSLTAGDWDVWGNVGFVPNGGTTVTALSGWVSSTSATLPDGSLRANVIWASASGTSWTLDPGFVVPGLRFSLSSTTTIYLSVYATFSGDTNAGYGGIYARRRR